MLRSPQVEPLKGLVITAAAAPGRISSADLGSGADISRTLSPNCASDDI
jgi:hypothetical protein